jgi:vacuolar-type H+-ATPase subunit I/STV1
MPKIQQYADQAVNLGGYRLNLQFFADDNGGNEPNGGNDPNGGSAPNGGNTPNGDPNNTPNNQPNDPPKTFTQEDVNNIVAREVKKTQEKLLKQLGIDDFNSAKEGLQKFREWQESQKTEAQKQAERLQKLEQDFNAVQKEKENLMAQLAAVKAGVHADFVEDVIVLAQRLVNEDTTIDDAIAKVIEKYPHFKQAAQQQQDQQPKPTFSVGTHQKTDTDAFIKALLGK